jgi:hypothetical protein
VGSVKHSMDMTGKVALVTGGNPDDLAAAQTHLAGLGIESDWIAADSAKGDQIVALVDEAPPCFSQATPENISPGRFSLSTAVLPR